MLIDLSNQTRDQILRKKIKQTLAQQPVVKLKSIQKNTVPNLKESSSSNNDSTERAAQNDSEDFLKSEDSEASPPKRLTIIFAN
jgi:hypothetical protein